MKTPEAKKKKKEEEEEQEEGMVGEGGGREGRRERQKERRGDTERGKDTIKHIILLLFIRSLIISIITVVSGASSCLQQISDRELFKKSVCTKT